MTTTSAKLSDQRRHLQIAHEEVQKLAGELARECLHAPSEKESVELEVAACEALHTAKQLYSRLLEVALEDDYQQRQCMADWADAHGEDRHEAWRDEALEMWADDGGSFR